MKLVHPETETEALKRYLARRRSVPKVTSAVAYTELPRAVRRVNHDPAGRVHDCEVMDQEIEKARLLLQTVRMVEVTRAVLSDAASADGPFLRALDAIHLVAASRVAIGMSAFITYDKRLAVAAEEAGLPVTAPA
jgi:predicted nucleic acid-binding protein